MNEYYLSWLPSGFVVDKRLDNGYLRIKTPLLFPDGSNIDIFCCTNKEGNFIVTDFGEAETYLFNACQTVDNIKDIAESFDISYVDGEITVTRRTLNIESRFIAIACVAMAVCAASQNGKMKLDI